MSTDGSALGYAELLRLAKTEGLQELDTTVIQIPNDANSGHAVVLAAARTQRSLFRAIGEAWRDTLPIGQRGHTLIVAEHRAKTRALCEAVGMPQPLPAALPEQTTPAETRVQEAVPQKSQLPRRDDRSAAPAQAPAASAQAATAASPAAPLPVAEAPAAEETSPAARRPTPQTPVPLRSVAASGAAPVPTSEAEGDDPVQGASPRARVQPPRAPSRAAPAPQAEGLGPDSLQRLLRMTRQIAHLEGVEMSEEDAMRKLDSFFQRAFGHSMDLGTRMEGERVVQRLAAEVARLRTEDEAHPVAATR